MVEGASYDGIGHTPNFRVLPPEEAATVSADVRDLDAETYEEGNPLPDMSGVATDLISVQENPWDERSPE